MFIETSAKAGYNVKQVSGCCQHTLVAGALPWILGSLGKGGSGNCSPHTASNASEWIVGWGSEGSDLASHDLGLLSPYITEELRKKLCEYRITPSWGFGNPRLLFRLRHKVGEAQVWDLFVILFQWMKQTSEGGAWWFKMLPVHRETEQLLFPLCCKALKVPTNVPGQPELFISIRWWVAFELGKAVKGLLNWWDCRKMRVCVLRWAVAL